MEADWSVELAAADPVIVVPWSSMPGSESAGADSSASFPGIQFHEIQFPEIQFIDVRANPQSIDRIEEARNRPALRSVLARLNASDSGLWTAKCDVWLRGGDLESGDEIDPIDPWEMEATGEEARFAVGSYIDILALDLQARGSFTVEENWMRRLVEQLRHRPLRCARTDFVLRRSAIHGVDGFGVTWFAEGCGQTAELAERKWAQALAEILPVVMSVELA
jgi:hypothetical protein